MWRLRHHFLSISIPAQAKPVDDAQGLGVQPASYDRPTSVMWYRLLLQNKSLLSSLQSSKEEFSIVDEALLMVEGETAAVTMHKLVTGFNFESSIARFETCAGRVGCDCETKVRFYSESVSIDNKKRSRAAGA